MLCSSVIYTIVLCMYIKNHHLELFFFFFNDTATTEIYTLSLHDALPISPTPTFRLTAAKNQAMLFLAGGDCSSLARGQIDRKSTRLNSSHSQISYAVFCLKKKKTKL